MVSPAPSCNKKANLEPARVASDEGAADLPQSEPQQQRTQENAVHAHPAHAATAQIDAMAILRQKRERMSCGDADLISSEADLLRTSIAARIEVLGQPDERTSNAVPVAPP